MSIQSSYRLCLMLYLKGWFASLPNDVVPDGRFNFGGSLQTKKTVSLPKKLLARPVSAPLPRTNSARIDNLILPLT
jgi:hypothetical protein